MTQRHMLTMSWDDARKLLGVVAGASDEDLRQAYLAKVREFPPDHDPDAFERIRDAYDQLKDPRNRARQIFNVPDPFAPVTDLLIGLRPTRRFAGAKLWTEALKEKMKEARS